MTKKYDQVWVDEATKRRLKSQAALKGMKLSEYVKRLSESGKVEDEKTKRKYGGGFF